MPLLLEDLGKAIFCQWVFRVLQNPAHYAEPVGSGYLICKASH